ncbi:MAG: TIGR03885 family FMN-dependent LLM class oxidoreductase, partial [Herpetosiphonaceae bacterium]|nr:TIGR03885 family FMN-dependent LLM class oxidoreductase [Herpetosiphonaceae bacterium]
ASHEQFRPSELLEYVQLAEAAGFRAAMCSDHFHPWSDSQGQSGYAWSWLGAAMQASGLSFGLVNAPGQRYHPAIIAQAAATLAELFPGRLWVALGSGQALNEHITGARWPSKAERNERLREAVAVIRALWAGQTVSHQGSFTVEDARLYTLPQSPPLIVGAAITPQTAEWVGGWADALITVSQPPEQLAEVVARFRAGGGAGKPMFLKAQHSYDRSETAARQGAHEQWRMNILPSGVLAELRLPAQFEQAAIAVQPDDLDQSIRISADPQRHLEWLRGDLALGFERVFVHNVNRNQRGFIEDFGEHVLPGLAASGGGND